VDEKNGANAAAALANQTAPQAGHRDQNPKEGTNRSHPPPALEAPGRRGAWAEADSPPIESGSRCAPDAVGSVKSKQNGAADRLELVPIRDA